MEPIEVVVKAGNHDRRACPVWVQLPLEQGTPALRMTDEQASILPATPSSTIPLPQPTAPCGAPTRGHRSSASG